VSALRNAKAAEMQANADYTKAKIAMDQALATAEAAFKTAEAALKTAEADYKTVEADYKKAEAEYKRAQMEWEAALQAAMTDQQKAVTAQQKAQTEAYIATQANLLDQAKVTLEEAQANLEVAKAEAAVAIAEQENLLAQAELNGKLELIRLQRWAILNAGALQGEIAAQYAYQLGQLQNVLANINIEKGKIATATLAKATAQAELAAYVIDSARFVNLAIAGIEQNIAEDSVKLAYAVRELAVWESDDIKELNKLKEDLINDTVRAVARLARMVEREAEAASDTVAPEADLVAAKEAQEAAQEAFDNVNAEYGALWQAVTDANADLARYNEITSGYVLVPKHTYLTNSGWRLDPVYNHNGVTYDAKIFSNYTGDMYSFPRYNDYIDVDVYISYGLTKQYIFYVYERNWENRSEGDYTSAADYEHQIQLWQHDSIDYKKQYDLKEVELKDSLLKLIALGTAERAAYDKYQDSVAGTKTARELERKALANLEKAQANYDLNVTAANLNARDLARVEYDGYHPTNGTTTDTRGAVGARERAEAIEGNTYNKWQAALIAYNTTNDKIRFSLIDDVISWKNNVVYINGRLEEAYDNLKFLEKYGTRDQLQFALDAAIKAYNDGTPSNDTEEYTALQDANKAYQDANTAYQDAQNAYTRAKNNLRGAQRHYRWLKSHYEEINAKIEYIDWQISVGGSYTPDVDGNDAVGLGNASEIAQLTKNIITLEANLESYAAKLADITKYADDTKTALRDIYGNPISNLTVKAVIDYYNKLIIDADEAIAKATSKITELEASAQLYQTAIDTLIKYSEAE
jgi:hypothetical protein